MVVTQTMLGIEGDELAISMDMFDAENQERYLDEREMYYDDEDINPDHLPGLVDINDMPPTTAEVGLETGDSQDTEKKKVDKGKGKAVDKGKGKARDKGKGRARASPYSFIASRTHHEGNGHIPRLGMTGYNRPDWISRILDRPTNFDNLYEGRNEFSHYSSAPHLDPYGYSGIPIASGSGTRRDD
ncbi:hypothetical protein BDZ94DRAFT_727843 [Collybia nuda]|uniref:Uncharacterized protein n=1 Tax=Collybia nuda TaxID=64659 RepID=A0A9P6CE01_9AGAR|nr:hypothetical protein BDZ94DRAFT_727843 [Collybia nuda]